APRQRMAQRPLVLWEVAWPLRQDLQAPLLELREQLGGREEFEARRARARAAARPAGRRLPPPPRRWPPGDGRPGPPRPPGPWRGRPPAPAPRRPARRGLADLWLAGPGRRQMPARDAASSGRGAPRGARRVRALPSRAAAPGPSPTRRAPGRW